MGFTPSDSRDQFISPAYVARAYDITDDRFDLTVRDKAVSPAWLAKLWDSKADKIAESKYDWTSTRKAVSPFLLKKMHDEIFTDKQIVLPSPYDSANVAYTGTIPQTYYAPSEVTEWTIFYQLMLEAESILAKDSRTSSPPRGHSFDSGKWSMSITALGYLADLRGRGASYAYPTYNYDLEWVPLFNSYINSSQKYVWCGCTGQRL